jgi:KDO2-lipid IV(A) lauroyltransferase
MRSYLRYWMELFRLPAISPDRVVSRFEIKGLPPLREAFDAGRGVIIALPHTGNWDHAGAWAVLQGFPVTTVAERVRPEQLFDKFVAFRESLGMEVLALTGSGRNVFGTLVQRLRAGRVVCLVADRDLSDSGTPVTFFGAKTRMPGGPAALALHTGAALFPATLSFTRDGWAATVHPEIVPPADGTREEKLRAMTQAMADDFAAGIAESPQDWHMLQPFWLDDRP